MWRPAKNISASARNDSNRRERIARKRREQAPALRSEQILAVCHSEVQTKNLLRDLSDWGSLFGQKPLQFIDGGGDAVSAGFGQLFEAAVAVEHADGGKAVFLRTLDIMQTVAHHDHTA